MDVILEILDGPALGEQISLTSGTLVLGRSVAGPGRLGGDAALSRQHARLFLRGNEVWVEDLNSSNGTYVNGDQIERPTRASAGDLIFVGETTLRVLRDDTADPAGSVPSIETAERLYSAGSYADALTILEQLRGAGLRDPRIEWAIAACHLQLGNDEAAERAYTELLRREPASEEARRLLDEVRRRRLKREASLRGEAPLETVPTDVHQVTGETYAGMDALPQPQHLRDPVICGVVESVRGAPEPTGMFAGHAPAIQTAAPGQALTIRLRTPDGAQHTVVMRGSAFTGEIPEKGDRIAVPASRRVDGRLEVSRLENLETGSLVVAQRPSRLGGAVYALFGTFVVAFLVFIFAVVISGMLGHPILGDP